MQLPMMASPSASFFLPRSMENSGPPPVPIRLANATMIVTIGKQMPTPVSAVVAWSIKRPM